MTYRKAQAGVLAVPAPARAPIATLAGLRFSPDGTELAALIDEASDSRILVWNLADGSLAVDHVFAGQPKSMAPGASSYTGPIIEWLPDGSAWLLAGHVVVDRAGGRPVWMFRTETWFKDPGPRKMIDNDRMLACVGPDRGKRLEIIPLPWARIDSALKQMADPASKALVRPGGSVGLKVEVAQVTHGDREATRQELIRALTSRLEAEGLTVAEGQSAVFHVKYAESKGETLQEYQRQAGGSPFNPGTPTGRSVTATQGVCNLAWEVSGKKTPVWTGKVAYNPVSMSIRGEVSDAKVREASFNQMKYTLALEAVPYYIADGNPPMMLPGVTELKDAPAKRTNRATTRPTQRGQAPAKKK